MAGSVTVLDADGTASGDPLPIEASAEEASPATDSTTADPDPPIVFIPPPVYAGLVLPGLHAATRMGESEWRGRFGQVPGLITPKVFDNVAEVSGALVRLRIPDAAASGWGVVAVVRHPPTHDYELAALRAGMPDGLHLIVMPEDHPAATAMRRPGALEYDPA